MKTETTVKALLESYKQQLLLAVQERSSVSAVDPELDLFILSLIGRLETLEWVLADTGQLPAAACGSCVLH